MSELESELDKLRQALDAYQAQGAAPSPEQARLLRFASASTSAPSNDHERAQARMPEMAEAELRGERISRLFPEAVAHLDICESCSLEYAELLDALMALEEAVDRAATSAPSPLPQRMALVLRLRGWVTQGVETILGKLQLVDISALEPALQTFMARLPYLPPLSQPRVMQQAALAFPAASKVTPVLWATWATTETLAEQYSTRQLAEMAAQGTLAAVVRRTADQTAQYMRISGKDRGQFVDEYVAFVQSEIEQFVALGKST